MRLVAAAVGLDDRHRRAVSDVDRRRTRHMRRRPVDAPVDLQGSGIALDVEVEALRGQSLIETHHDVAARRQAGALDYADTDARRLTVRRQRYAVGDHQPCGAGHLEYWRTTPGGD